MNRASLEKRFDASFKLLDGFLDAARFRTEDYTERRRAMERERDDLELVADDDRNLAILYNVFGTVLRCLPAPETN